MFNDLTSTFNDLTSTFNDLTSIPHDLMLASETLNHGSHVGAVGHVARGRLLGRSPSYISRHGARNAPLLLQRSPGRRNTPRPPLAKTLTRCAHDKAGGPFLCTSGVMCSSGILSAHESFLVASSNSWPRVRARDRHRQHDWRRNSANAGDIAGLLPGAWASSGSG